MKNNIFSFSWPFWQFRVENAQGIMLLWSYSKVSNKVPKGVSVTGNQRISQHLSNCSSVLVLISKTLFPNAPKSTHLTLYKRQYEFNISSSTFTSTPLWFICQKCANNEFRWNRYIFITGLHIHATVSYLWKNIFSLLLSWTYCIFLFIMIK